MLKFHQYYVFDELFLSIATQKESRQVNPWAPVHFKPLETPLQHNYHTLYFLQFIISKIQKYFLHLQTHTKPKNNYLLLLLYCLPSFYLFYFTLFIIVISYY